MGTTHRSTRFLRDQSLTLSLLARARGLDPARLAQRGWKNHPLGVAIPWARSDGQTAWHIRVTIDEEAGRPRWLWLGRRQKPDPDTPTPPRLVPYGADALALIAPAARQAGWGTVVVVESELDCEALLGLGIPALAAGGAENWDAAWYEALAGWEKIAVWLEDTPGVALLRAVVETARAHGQDGRVWVCQSLTQGAKDACRLVQKAGASAPAQVRAVVAGARPVLWVDTADALLPTILRLLEQPVEPDRPTYTLCCPFHDDHHPSLSVFQTEEGGWAFRCHSGRCGIGGPLELLGALLGVVGPATRARPRRVRALADTASGFFREGLPTIEVVSHLPTLAAAAWEALGRVNTPTPVLFRRAPGELVRLERTDDGRAVLVPLDRDRLWHELWNAANWVRVVEGEEQTRLDPASPPQALVAYLLAQRYETVPLPPIHGIVSGPVVLPGGRLVTTRGYDPEARLYLDLSGEEIGDLPTRPTAAEVQTALATLWEVVADFPFAGESDVANSLAIPLTVLCRPLIAGPTPLLMVDAPDIGTGKSLLVKALLLTVLGRIPHVRALPGDDEELRKMLTAALVGGETIFVFDNLTWIDSPVLAAVLTGEEWADRRLGQSQTIRYSLAATTWVATANNPTLSDEIARRTVRVRLQAMHERPWEADRVFRHPDLLGWIREHRPRLLRALLVLVQNWWAQGCPEPAVRPLASYEAWTRVIGGILTAAGVSGFLGNRFDALTYAPERRQARAFVLSWWTAHADRPVLARDLLPLAVEADLPLRGESETARVRSLGRWLERHRDRVFTLDAGSVRIDLDAKDPHAKTNRWRLAPIAGEPGGPPDPARAVFRVGDDSAGSCGKMREVAGITGSVSQTEAPEAISDAATGTESGGHDFPQLPATSAAATPGLFTPSGETPTTVSIAPAPDFPLEVIRDADALAQALPILARAPALAVDVETTGDDPHRARVRIVSLSDGDHVWVVDCFAVDPAPLWSVLAAAQIVGHHLVFDLRFLRALGLEVGGLCLDTMVLDQLLRADGRPRSLQALAEECLGLAMDKTLQKSDWSGALTPAQLRYAGLDAWVAWQLGQALRDRAVDRGLEQIVAVEAAALPVVAAMTSWGLPIEKERWQALVARCAEEAENARAHLGRLLGPVDPDSPKQLLGALRALGLTVEKTDEAALAPHRDHPVVAALLAYRQAVRQARLFSGVDFRPHPVTGRIHADWQQIGAPTGRMSCRRPNLQALPRDPAVRACIRPPEGWVFVKADFSQIELRVAAELSGDGRLIQAFRRGEDVHLQTARLVLGREPSKEDRQLAKGLNFGLLYGAGPETLATYLRTAYGVDVSVAEAARLRARFFAAYPVLRRWQRRLMAGSGELRTVLGRLLRPTRPTDRTNYPVQGSAADGLKVALGLLRSRLPQGARIIAAVHDEVLVECPLEQAATVVETVREALVEGMRNVLRRVPVGVETGVFEDWGVTPATVAASGPTDGRGESV